MHTLSKNGFWVAAGMLAAALTGGGAEEADKMADGLYAKVATSKGEILLRLEYEKTPMTVANFVGLAEGTKTSNKAPGTPFYNGLKFHRVIPKFMIQGGCPEGTGRGGPGYKFIDEIDPSLKHDRPGVLSMANAGPDTNGSQFFITHVPTPWLDGKHTVFGSVVKGQDVVDSVAGGDEIKSVSILRVGDKAKAFKSDEAAFQASLQAATARKADAARKASEERLADVKKRWPQATVTASGLMYVSEQAGKGDAKPAKGATVKVHYTGELMDGTKFDSSVDRGTPFSFKVGLGEVIPGWDEGVMDMKKDEKRVLIVPSNLAYGARGVPNRMTGNYIIPPNATLVFKVHLIDFE